MAFDFNDLFSRMGMGAGGGGGGGSSSDDVVQQDPSKLIEKGANKIAATIAKLIGGPLGRLIPTNAGEVGLVKDRPSWIDKKMNEGAQSMNARGGVIASATLGTFKNSTITDQTVGVGGGANIEAMASGGGPEISGIPIEGLPTGGARFESMAMSESFLGSLTPMAAGGGGRSASVDIG